MRKWFEIGGIVAAVVLIALGVASIALGFSGRNTVTSSLKQEQITGTPDMTPALISAEAKKAGLDVAKLPIPSCTAAGKAVTDGDTGRCFAQYMRIHTLEATGGLVYAQMGRYQAKPGAPAKVTDGQGSTNDTTWALVDPKTKQPVSNARRDIWVTETALTTALNTSYMASRIALFGVMVGFTLLISGIGLGILAVGGALRSKETALGFIKQKIGKTGGNPVPAA